MDAGDENPTQQVVVVKRPAEPRRAPEPSNSRRSQMTDVLDMYGTLILWLCGAGLVALACVFADKPAVAPIFGVFGAGMIILAVFRSRIEGRVKGGAQGVEAAVRGAKEQSSEEQLPPNVTVEVMERAAATAAALAQTGKDAQEVADAAVREAVGWGTRQTAAREDALLRRFEDWLAERAELPIVRRQVRTPDATYDLLAESADAILIVDARVGELVDANAVTQLRATPPPTDTHDRTVRRALVVPSDAKVSLAAIHDAGVADVEVYEVWPEGRVERVA
jgi:hypothetical protein